MERGGIVCPRDQAHAKLLRRTGGAFAFDIDFCEKCGGTWLDRGEFAKLAGSPQAERLLADYAAGQGEIDCPRDGQRMARRPIGTVTVDVCPSCHGMWFDREEIAAAEEEIDHILHGAGLPKRSGLEVGIHDGEYQRAALLAAVGPSIRKQMGFAP